MGTAGIQSFVKPGIPVEFYDYDDDVVFYIGVPKTVRKDAKIAALPAIAAAAETAATAATAAATVPSGPYPLPGFYTTIFGGAAPVLAARP